LTPGAFNTLTNSLAQAPVNEFTTGNSVSEHIQNDTEGHVQGVQLVVRHDATTDDIGPALSMDNEEVLTPGAFNTLTNSLAQAPVNESCVEQDGMDGGNTVHASRGRNRQYDDSRSMSEANWSTQKPG